MNTPTATLEQAIDTASRIDADALPLMGAEDLLLTTARIEELGRIVDAQRVATTTEVVQRSNRLFGADGLAAKHGCRNTAELLERVTGVSSSTARQRLRIASLTGARRRARAATQPSATLGACCASFFCSRSLRSPSAFCSAPGGCIDAACGFAKPMTESEILTTWKSFSGQYSV